MNVIADLIEYTEWIVLGWLTVPVKPGSRIGKSWGSSEGLEIDQETLNLKKKCSVPAAADLSSSRPFLVSSLEIKSVFVRLDNQQTEYA